MCSNILDVADYSTPTAIAMALKSARLVKVKFSYEMLYTITSGLHVVAPNKSGLLGHFLYF